MSDKGIDKILALNVIDQIFLSASIMSVVGTLAKTSVIQEMTNFLKISVQVIFRALDDCPAGLP